MVARQRWNVKIVGISPTNQTESLHNGSKVRQVEALLRSGWNVEIRLKQSNTLHLAPQAGMHC